MTYLNESEVDDEGFNNFILTLDNSPNNLQDYYITEEMIGLELLFEFLQLNGVKNLYVKRLTIRRKKSQVIQMVMT